MNKWQMDLTIRTRADYSIGAKNVHAGAVMPCAVMRYDIAASLAKCFGAAPLTHFFADREVTPGTSGRKFMSLPLCSASGQPLAEVIERFVRSRTGGMVRGLHVEVVEDHVVLSGRASTYYAKQLATHAAFDFDRELALTNDIEVC
jgi:hypothetical protein